MENNNKHQWIELGTIITILIPMFYTAGWSYAYHYFDCFRLGLMGLDIPKEYMFLYSFWAVKKNLLIFVLLLAVVGGGYILFKFVYRKYRTFFERRPEIFQAIAIVLIPVAILLMFWLFYWFGERAGKKDYLYQAGNGFSSYPRVIVWIKPEKEKKIPDVTVKEWQKGEYCLLLRGKDKLYLFYPVQKGGTTPTDVIPASRVEGVRILPY
ncbi:MAG: hypothetical protein GY795_49755 [Desulfobacterales bacterium]|nr:hypothetical protein [Desulfobacterales bacterium]